MPLGRGGGGTAGPFFPPLHTHAINPIATTHALRAFCTLRSFATTQHCGQAGGIIDFFLIPYYTRLVTLHKNFLHSSFSTLRIFHTPHFLHSSFSTLLIFYTLHFPHSSFSTLLIFHTPGIFYTPHFPTPHFLHSTLRTPHIPPNPKF